MRAAWLLVVLAGGALADEPDEVLAALTEEAVNARPELAQARAQTQAARERVPQAGAWPDPMLQVGVQNDTFNSWQVGKMETSWVLFMASQTIPFPGKTALRSALATVEVDQRALDVERLRLTTIADVRRAYLALQLARVRLELLSRLTTLVQQALDVAQSRYEVGQGAQADVLRARLELGRLGPQRELLLAQETTQVQALNRLRNKPLDEPIAGRALSQLAFPPPPDEAAAVATFLERSPERRASQLDVDGAQRARELATRQYFPDFSVGAGVMVRGQLPPMWSLTLGVPVPVFAASRQSREVAEAEARREAAGHGVTSVEQLIALRTSQRLATWRRLRTVWDSYQGSLLADAAATADATLTQYRVGAVPFAAVLESAATTISLHDAAYGVLADAWRLAIAQDELSLADASAGGL